MRIRLVSAFWSGTGEIQQNAVSSLASELFALRWECFNYAESKMRISETAYHGFSSEIMLAPHSSSIINDGLLS